MDINLNLTYKKNEEIVTRGIAGETLLVPISDKLTLWIFGDTWIGDIIDGMHKNATIVNNSIGLQQGKDPSTASVRSSGMGASVAFSPR